MTKERLYLGRQGEEEAADFLKENGYRILARNYKSKLGEVDIIALDKDTLCFIEVKTRSSDRFGSPFDAVSKIKQRQISKAALMYLKQNNLLEKRSARFDVVSIIYRGNEPKLDLVKDAFVLDEKFTC